MPSKLWRSASNEQGYIPQTVSRSLRRDRAPVITEKATNVSEHNQVSSRCADATKPEIKKAVEGLFKVKVKAVNTSSARARASVPRPSRRAERRKKAIVTLAEGHTIDVTTGL
jgi:large subunit ribosomal protein L23